MWLSFLKSPLKSGLIVIGAAALALAFVPGAYAWLLGTGSFMPHGHCYLWEPGLVWLHATSDVMIGLSYVVIALALAHFIRKRPDLPFPWIFAAFGLFIVACGATHLMEVWTIWQPRYWLAGAVKVVTALASVATAILLPTLMPRALALPGRAELATMNTRLEEEVRERTAALTASSQALRGSEERFRNLVELLPQAVFETDLLGKLTFSNRAGFDFFGLAPGQLERGINVFDLVLPEDRPRARETMRKVVAGAKTTGHVYTAVRADGSTFSVELFTSSIVEHGYPVGMRGILVDVTERVRAEEQRRLLSTAVEHAHEAIVITDRDGRILYVNPSLEELTGYEKEEVLGLTPRIFKSGAQDRAFYEDLWRTILSGRVWSGPIVNRRKDGSRYVAHMVISPVRAASASITSFVATQRDVTQESELRKRLEQARHLETIGMIAGGVAHEVRNPLFAISTVTTALEKKLEGKEEFSEYTAHIRDQSRRLNHLMDDLLTLGRPIREEEFTHCPLGEVIHQSLALLERVRPGTRERLALDLGQGDLAVMGNSSKLVQVVLNLLDNGAHFTPAGESLAVRVRQDGSSAVLTVSDRGPGIAADLLPALFQPFQTRRPGGTGLGLAIVRQIVVAHGGRVEAANNAPGPGTTFSVTLPLAG